MYRKITESARAPHAGREREEAAFRSDVSPLLERGNIAGALQILEVAWPIDRLRRLLDAGDEQVAAGAARCIGYVGTMRHCALLTEVLDREGLVADAAEDALWTLWMRAGSPDARAQLRVAMEHLQSGEAESATRLLETLVLIEPHYAEAHHQLALARQEIGDFAGAAEAHRATLHENPHHYPALVGLGHLHIERDEFAAALAAYKAALKIHPNLSEIAAMLPALQDAVDTRHVA